MEAAERRRRMVEDDIAGRGIDDRRVLAAMREVPRERFLPAGQAEFAYRDTPLPIEEGQTISQPYIVALMAESVALEGHERVLEVGTGSGYGAAVLGRLARRVHSIERHARLADEARRRLAELGFDNVEVVEGDGTLGLAAEAPFDAIVVTAGGPVVPPALLDQLAIGGRLVIPVGTSRTQNLVRITRDSERQFRQEEIQPVRFVPLIGAAGWQPRQPAARTPAPSPAPAVVARGAEGERHGLSLLLRECGEPLATLDAPALDAVVDRIGDARVVLIGEATHGTSEFYRVRAALTRRLVERKGFRIVAAEADWPDAAAVDRYVRSIPNGHAQPGDAFRRFPLWMWRNQETRDFVEWLRGRNLEASPEARAGFHGLDLYSMFTSIRAVLGYLDRVDPDAARVARVRYGCLTPWEKDPQTYGRAALAGRYRVCEDEAVAMLRHLLARRLDYGEHDGARFLDAMQNARLVANAERYYRAMYYGRADSWNLRDRHMFDTLGSLLAHAGPAGRAVVWAHNSHVGDAAATEMAARGELNLGQLCRAEYGAACYAIGFGTDHGRVAAAHDWDGPMEEMSVRNAHPLSYERLFHLSERPAFLLPLRHPVRREVRDELTPPRLERAIGVVYRPATEMESHYFHATLPAQFDEYIWVDESSAVAPITEREARGFPAAHPFAWR